MNGPVRFADENSLFFRSPRLVADFEAFFDRVWDSLPKQWSETARPTRSPRSRQPHCSDGIDNDFDELIERPGVRTTHAFHWTIPKNGSNKPPDIRSSEVSGSSSWKFPLELLHGAKILNASTVATFGFAPLFSTARRWRVTVSILAILLPVSVLFLIVIRRHCVRDQEMARQALPDARSDLAFLMNLKATASALSEDECLTAP